MVVVLCKAAAADHGDIQGAGGKGVFPVRALVFSMVRFIFPSNKLPWGTDSPSLGFSFSDLLPCFADQSKLCGMDLPPW